MARLNDEFGLFLD